MSDNPGAEILASSLSQSLHTQQQSSPDRLEDTIQQNCDEILQHHQSGKLSHSDAIQALDLLKDATPDIPLQNTLESVIDSLKDTHQPDEIRFFSDHQATPSHETSSGVSSHISFDANDI